MSDYSRNSRFKCSCSTSDKTSERIWKPQTRDYLVLDQIPQTRTSHTHTERQTGGGGEKERMSNICWRQLSPQKQGKENIQDFDCFTQVYIKLSLLMTIFEASHFVQYLNNKLFSIKAEDTATV